MRRFSPVRPDMNIHFFFQAEDGIRDDLVTGVQTCALPICSLRHHEQKQRCHLQFGQDGSVGYEDGGDASPGREQHTIARHEKEMTEFATKGAKEIEEKKLPLPDDRLHIAPDKIKDQHAGNEMPDVVIDQWGGKKLPGISVRNTAVAKPEIFENESAIPGGEDNLNDEGRGVQAQ